MGKYDLLDRAYFTSLERMADLIKVGVFRGRMAIDASELSALNVRYQSLRSESGEYERDGLCVCEAHNIKYGLEIENHTDFGMSRRILVYDACEYEKEASENKKDHLARGELANFEEKKSGMLANDRQYSIIDIVLFLGMGHYKGPRNLKEMLKPIPEDVKPFVQDKIPNYGFVLMEADSVNPDDFNTDLRVFFKLMQARNNPKKMKDLIQGLESEELSIETQRVITVHLGKKDLIKKVIEEGENMCKALREIDKMNREEGRREGIINTLISLVKDGLLLLTEGAKRAGMSESDFAKLL